MKKRVVVKIFGEVQGIFFRAQTKEEADKLGLVGWVRNEADGTVMVVAEGEEKNLEKLIEYCKIGPKFAKVNKVEVKWGEANGEFKEFVIR